MSRSIPAKPPAPLLELRGVSKRFPGVRALDNVHFTLDRGEVLALIGENGAGKSTLMKILAGVQRADRGLILIDGRQVGIDSVHQGLEHGIALIHQELNLAGNLDVGANIFLGREPRRMGWIDKTTIHHQARHYLEKIGLAVSPATIVGDLPIGQQQLVEIAKALSVDARVLIMDEPTSSLSAGETATLFQVVRELRARGVSVIYISHRLGEVQELADRVVVLRDGQRAGELSRQQISHDAMVRLMVGRDVSQFYARRPHPIGDTCLEVAGLVTPAWPQHRLSFQVRAGEIVGVAGLVGAGRTEMVRTLFGIDQPLAGSVRVQGRALNLKSPLAAIRKGLALVPEDRQQHGLVVEMTVRQNTSLASLRQQARLGTWVNQAEEARLAEQMVRRLATKTPSLDQVVQCLSGGNQQKVVLGKWLSLAPQVLLLDEPTRGIDVGAKEEIYRLMEALAEQGIAILFVSSEMEEILGMSDRVLVMHEGQITGELAREQLSEEAIMQLATGGTRAA